MVTTSSNFVVYGEVRGLVSEHRTLAGAKKSLARDREGCKSQGGYSDARIYEAKLGKYKTVRSEWFEQVEA